MSIQTEHYLILLEQLQRVRRILLGIGEDNLSALEALQLTIDNLVMLG